MSVVFLVTNVTACTRVTRDGGLLANTFKPPANLDDFDRSPRRVELYGRWHDRVNGWVSGLQPEYPAAFSGIVQTGGAQVFPANPEWTGMPRTIKRLIGNSVSAAARLIDDPREIGVYDPVDDNTYERFKKADGRDFVGPAYRSQDEYLEWVVKRDADGVISEILFTCEGPEYWEQIAEDQDLLLTLYKEICGDETITIEDLTFPERVTWVNPYNSSGNADTYPKGSYNPFNAWNTRAAVHLTQPANTLGAEVRLAFDATYPYGSPDLVTSDPDLACCAAYGGINRMSDPTIGAGVNTQVVSLGRKVALRNPIGLYIKGLRPNAFTLEGGAPFEHQEESWEILRPKPAQVTDMIVRARFRVPDGITYKGKQLRVGDLFMQGEQIVFGGQVADAVTMIIYAIAISGAPSQPARACRYSPCFSAARPDFVQVVNFGQPCPDSNKQGTPFAGPAKDLRLVRERLVAPEKDLVITRSRVPLRP